jgi:cobalamin biosynthesis Mg chelatase CobN
MASKKTGKKASAKKSTAKRSTTAGEASVNKAPVAKKAPSAKKSGTKSSGNRTSSGDAASSLDVAREALAAAAESQQQQARDLHLLYNDLRKTCSDIEKAKGTLTSETTARRSEIDHNLRELGDSRKALAAAAEKTEKASQNSGSNGHAPQIVIGVLVVIVLILVGVVKGKVSDLEAKIDQLSANGTLSASESKPAGARQNSSK